MLDHHQVQISQEELFRRAIQLVEMLGIVDFDQTVEALKKANGDMEQAKKILSGLSYLQYTV
jgi:hypothetical protein